MQYARSVNQYRVDFRSVLADITILSRFSMDQGISEIRKRIYLNSESHYQFFRVARCRTKLESPELSHTNRYLAQSTLTHSVQLKLQSSLPSLHFFDRKDALYLSLKLS